MRFVVGILAVILAIAAIVGARSWSSNPPTAPGVANERVYSSPDYPITFRYPDSYVLEERDNPGSAERLHHTITLARRDDLPPPQGGEGPPSISIDFYQNNLDQLSTEAWIRNSNNSNFKLSNQVLATTTLAGYIARAYTWDGLYRGDTVALAREDFVIAFSVTYLTLEDDIRRDFTEILRTVTIQ